MPMWGDAGYWGWDRESCGVNIIERVDPVITRFDVDKRQSSNSKVMEPNDALCNALCNGYSMAAIGGRRDDTA